MLSKYLKMALAAFTVLLLVSACKKDFGDLNISPNAPSVPSTRFLFGNAVINVGNNVSGVQGAAGALYAQHMAEFVYTQESRYFIKIYNYDPIYAGPLMDLQTIINLNTDATTRNTKAVLDNGSTKNQLGHARIMKAFLMLHITDRWGDVPYSQAFKGAANNKPAFDPQRTIYLDLLKELKEAVAQITGGLPNDPLFDGNANRWKTWGNSLRAIIALRMAKTADVGLAQTAFNEAVAAGIMGANSDNAIFKYLANANFESPWYTNYVRQGRFDYGSSASVVDIMKANNDPRLPIFSRPAIVDGTYSGLPYGKDAYYNVTDYSLLGRAIYAQGSSFQLTTYAQMCFSMAEAALRDWIPGGDVQVAAWYEKGINASMDQWAAVSTNPLVTISAAQKAAYKAQLSVDILPVNTLTFNEKLARIHTQKWLNFYMNNGYEAWAEWRRTGYPVLAPAINPLNANGQIPRRQCYPTTEKDLNSTNYASVVARQGADELSTRMWWDK